MKEWQRNHSLLSLLHSLRQDNRRTAVSHASPAAAHLFLPSHEGPEASETRSAPSPPHLRLSTATHTHKRKQSGTKAACQVRALTRLTERRRSLWTASPDCTHGSASLAAETGLACTETRGTAAVIDGAAVMTDRHSVLLSLSVAVALALSFPS